MHIIIMGAGVIGVTTAYFLSLRGHQVTVIDKNPHSASECSFANGGQLSYCHVEPWANSSTIPNIIKWLGKKDSPLVFHFRYDPMIWQWGLRFVKNCSTQKSLVTTEQMCRLSLYSRAMMHALDKDTSLDFSYQKNGVLRIFSHQKGLDLQCQQAQIQQEWGCSFSVLTPAECIQKEPALAQSTLPLVGGAFFPLDEVGNANHFTLALAELCRKRGVTFLHNQSIKQIVTNNDTISHIILGTNEILKADAYVMALGAYSPHLARSIGLSLPIYPMKGYSLSLPVNEHRDAPSISITDQSQKLVFTRLGNILRVAGTAEFAGYDLTLPHERLSSLERAVTNLFPSLMTEEITSQMTYWSCLRPSTPDGKPILGKTIYTNLFMNTGHGTLGWTLACGSAQVVADIVEGKEPEIDISAMTMHPERGCFSTLLY